MNLFDKIANIFGYAKQTNYGHGIMGQGTFGAFDTPRGTQQNYSAYLKKYADIAWVFSCVAIIADKSASIPLRIHKKKIVKGNIEHELMPDHLLQKMIDTVNPFMGGYDLRESTSAFLKLTGNAYWLLDNFKDGKPTEIYPLKPQRVKIVPHKTEYISKYVYEISPGNIIPIEKEHILHFRTFNPIDDYYGLPPGSAARVSIDSQEYGDKYNRNFFLNSANPSGQLTTPQNLNEDQMKRIKTAWQQAHQGYNNAHRTVLLTGATEWKSITPTHKEMMFPELKKMSREDILTVYRVPPVMVGILEYANYANAQEQRRIFWIDTIIPLVNKIIATINSFLIDPYDPSVTIIPDFTGIEALKDDEKLVADTNAVYINSGVKTINEVREHLKLPPVPWGATWNAPMNLIPITEPRQEPTGASIARVVCRACKKTFDYNSEQEVAMGAVKCPHCGTVVNQEGHAAPEAPEGAHKVDIARSQEDIDKDARTKIWEVFKRASEAWERKYWPILRNLFADQEKETIRNLQDSDWKSFSAQIKMDGFANFKQKIDVILFDGKEARKKFRKAERKQLEAALTSRAKEEINTLDLGIAFNVENPAVQDYLDKRSFKFADEVNDTTEDSLRRELKAAAEAGEGIKETEKRIERIFDIARGSRTRKIARTEMISALNKGALESYDQSGVVKKKKWISSRDAEVRVTHQIDGETRLIANAFSNGLMYPGDEGAPADEVINCRCTLTAEISR